MANGELKLGTDVVLVENGQYLAPKAAQYWRLMKAAAKRDGVNLSINEGYRSYARQVYYRARYLAGLGSPAGIPGTSKHGEGLAVDVFLNDGVFEWLTVNAARFGWSWTQGRQDGERWHWVFDLTPTVPLPKPSSRKKPIVNRAVLKGTKKVAYFGEVSFFETTDGSVDDNALGRFYGKPGLVVTQAEWDAYKRVAAANAAKLV